MRDHTAISLWGLMALGIGWAAAVYFGDNAPKPIRADPQPTAICAINEDTVTADGEMLWPEGFAAPCKWFKKEQDV